MKYLLMIYSEEASAAKMSASAAGEMMAAYTAYSEALVKAGVMVDGARLKPSDSATRVRVTSGKTAVLDGPYAESKEQLGGYYVIDVPDLDAAITWAARCPGAQYGTIELRPYWEM